MLSSKDGPLGVFSIMAGPWNLGRVGLGACLGEVLLASVNGSKRVLPEPWLFWETLLSGVT